MTILLHRLWWQCNNGNVHSYIQSWRRGGHITIYRGAASSSGPKWRSRRKIIIGLYMGRKRRTINAQAEIVVSELCQWVSKKTNNLMHKVWWYLNDTTVYLTTSLPLIKIKYGLYMICLSTTSYETSIKLWRTWSTSVESRQSRCLRWSIFLEVTRPRLTHVVEVVLLYPVSMSALCLSPVQLMPPQKRGVEEAGVQGGRKWQVRQFRE